MSILTFALSALVSETYPLLVAFWRDAAATRVAEPLRRPAEEPGGLEQSLEACRNEAVAKFDMLMAVNVADLIRSLR